MPRSSAVAKAFSPNPAARPVLKPPVDLNELEREVFADIVLGSPPDSFIPADVPLIAILAKNIVLERIAFGEMRAAGYISDDGRKWLTILQHATKEVRANSRTLSLTPASRQPVKPEELEPVSYYERMSLLEARRDDEPN